MTRDWNDGDSRPKRRAFGTSRAGGSQQAGGWSRSPVGQRRETELRDQLQRNNGSREGGDGRGQPSRGYGSREPSPPWRDHRDQLHRSQDREGSWGGSQRPRGPSDDRRGSPPPPQRQQQQQPPPPQGHAQGQKPRHPKKFKKKSKPGQQPRDAFSDGEVARGRRNASSDGEVARGRRRWRGGDGSRYYDFTSSSSEEEIRASQDREGTPSPAIDAEAAFAERGAIDKKIKEETKHFDVDLKAKHEVLEYERSRVPNKFEFLAASDTLTWCCQCKTINSPERKRVFIIPKFRCGGCGQKCLDLPDFNFCMANVRVNEELLLHTIFKQSGPECMANAMCLALLLMNTLECIVKDKNQEEPMKRISPKPLIDAYYDEYPLMKPDKVGKTRQRRSSSHQFIKMALMLKHKGIKLMRGGIHRIGDITFLDPNDHEAICTELANGVPLLAIFPPGINFADLGYCQLYRPPVLNDVFKCNNHHKQSNHGPKSIHESHMVVLLGPAFKGKDRGYWFANSQGVWCKRDVSENCHESDLKAVEYGIGKVEQRGLVYSVIKLWPFGKTADPGSVRLEDEDKLEDEGGDEKSIYRNKLSNKEKFMGLCWS